MIDDGRATLAKQGKPHYIEIQGNQYEGVTVWFNTLLASAGGSVLNAGRHRAVARRARRSRRSTIMKQLATLAGRRPVAVGADGERQPAGHGVGHGRVRAQLPVRLSVDEDQQARASSRTSSGRRTRRSNAGEPATVTIGGINLAVSKYSKHPALAFEAALCLREPRRTRRSAPSRAACRRRSPTSTTTRRSSQTTRSQATSRRRCRTPRPARRPPYQNLSIVISHAVSPPAGINPPEHGEEMANQLKDACSRRGWSREPPGPRLATSEGDADERERASGAAPRPPGTGPGKKQLSEGARAERRLGWLLCAPAVIIMVAVTGVPDRLRDLAVAAAVRPALPATRPSSSGSPTTARCSRPVLVERRCGSP